MILKKISIIDSLRGIAAFSVFLVHFTILFPHLEIKELVFSFGKVILLGQYGVALFFIISAYSLSHSYLNRKNDEKKYMKNFFIRRFFRIAPTYFIIITVMFMLGNQIEVYSNPSEDYLSLYNYLLHIFFINGFYPYSVNNILGVEWTIFVEIFFYVTFPFAILLTQYESNKKIIKYIFITVVISMIFLVFRKYFIDLPIYQFWIRYSPLEWYYSFLLGLLIYKVHILDNKINKLSKWIKTNSTLIVYLVLFSFLFLGYVKLPVQHYLVIALLCVFVLAMLNNENRTINILFNNIFWKSLGQVSYSFYLIHFLIIRYSIYLLEKNPELLAYFGEFRLSISFIFLFTVTYVLSFISYISIEKYSIKIGQKVVEYNENR